MSLGEYRRIGPQAPLRDWRTVSIPSELIEAIEGIVDSRKYGFRSVADFIDEAIKEHLKKFDKYPK